MENESIKDFVEKIHEILNSETDYFYKNDAEYIDLAVKNKVTLNEIRASWDKYPDTNPLDIVFNLIINSLKANEITKAKIGINEIMKFYILRVNDNSSEKISREVWHSLYLVAVFIAQDNYIYKQQIWKYMTQCCRPVCSYLLDENLKIPIEIFIEYIVKIGRLASVEELDTSDIQHILRNIEIQAEEKNWENISNSSKEKRHNLEV